MYAKIPNWLKETPKGNIYILGTLTRNLSIFKSETIDNNCPLYVIAFDIVSDSMKDQEKISVYSFCVGRKTKHDKNFFKNNVLKSIILLYAHIMCVMQTSKGIKCVQQSIF